MNLNSKYTDLTFSVKLINSPTVVAWVVVVVVVVCVVVGVVVGAGVVVVGAGVVVVAGVGSSPTQLP